jgi:hypothetical protein
MRQFDVSEPRGHRDLVEESNEQSALSYARLNEIDVIHQDQTRVGPLD